MLNRIRDSNKIRASRLVVSHSISFLVRKKLGFLKIGGNLR